MNNNDLSVPACRHHARMDGWNAKCQGGKCLPQKKQTQPAADSQKGKRRPFSSSYALELLDTLVSGVHLYINNPPLSLCAYAYICMYLSLSRQTLLFWFARFPSVRDPLISMRIGTLMDISEFLGEISDIARFQIARPSAVMNVEM